MQETQYRIDLWDEATLNWILGEEIYAERASAVHDFERARPFRRWRLVSITSRELDIKEKKTAANG